MEAAEPSAEVVFQENIDFEIPKNTCHMTLEVGQFLEYPHLVTVLSWAFIRAGAH